MNYNSLKRGVYLLGFIAMAGVIAGRAIRYGFGVPLFGTWAGGVASLAIMTPLVVAFGFMLLSGLPGGRRIVPVPGTRAQDLVLLILILAQLAPGSEISELVAPGWPGGSRELDLVSLFTLLTCVIARVIQLNMGPRIGVTLADTTSRAG
jgi:hypothetical protein